MSHQNAKSFSGHGNCNRRPAEQGNEKETL